MGIFESLSSTQQDLIKKHLDLVIDANQRINLTRIDSVDEGMILHVEDSLTALEEMNNAPEGLYGDMGSGAGYPGIPLAIATNRKTMLIDARKKKMETVNNIIKELGLSEQIETYAGRAELLARTQAETFSVLTARALSQLPVLLELASPLLKRGGLLICYKAQLDEAEFAHARQIQPLVGMTFESDRAFTLNGEYKRRILTYRKTGKPKIALPRQESQAQKHPLIQKGV